MFIKQKICIVTQIVSNKQRTAEQGWRSKVIKKLLQKEQN
jgi:hypothetical protein